jgi:hypothetical protein
VIIIEVYGNEKNSAKKLMKKLISCLSQNLTKEELGNIRGVIPSYTSFRFDGKFEFSAFLRIYVHLKEEGFKILSFFHDFKIEEDIHLISSFAGQYFISADEIISGEYTKHNTP